MANNQFGLSSGKWLMANCGKYPSEKNCKVVLLAPENQREELIEIAVNHAIASHGHKNKNELRTEINKIIETVSV